MRFTIHENEGPEIFDSKISDHMGIRYVRRASSGAAYTPGGRDVGFVESNSLRQPGTYSIDLLLGKEFLFSGKYYFRLFAQILNLTDHLNILFVYSDTGEPDFTFEGGYSPEYMQDPSNFGPPRSIRIGASFRF